MKSFARLLVCLPMLWVEVAFAADCTSNSYRLRSQEAVDSLGATGCDTISGSLTIESRPESDITNIDALSNLTSIGGDLVIEENSALQSLDGLVNLTSVPGRLYISSNDALTNIDGLGNLTSVGSDLFLYQNSALINLDGLGSLIGIGGYLSVSSNNALTNIDGLASLTSVGSSLGIRFNSALKNLDGLTSITSLVSSLSVSSNDTLTNIDGLGNLTDIGTSLSVTNNNALANLDGLSKLASVGGWLLIEGNDALTNINGLSKLGSIEGDRLDIRGNDSLSNVNGLVGITNLTGTVFIRENDLLENVDGLSNLTSIRRGSLVIYENPSLSHINGLAKLTSVQNGLRIRENRNLTNIDGLSNLTSVGSDLTILSNRTLANCQGLAPVLGWPNGPPEDDVGGDIEISGNRAGCTSLQQVLDSVSGPTKPVINQAVTSSNSISLVFAASSVADTPFVVTSYTATCTGADIDISASPAIDLLDNTPVQETLTVSGYDPSTVLPAIEVDISITHSDPTDLYITLTSPQGTEIVLWNQGNTGGEDMVGTFPTTLTAVDSFDGITGQAMDGDWVLSVEDIQVGPIVREGVLNSWGMRITEELTGVGASSPIELDGATQGRDYVCSVTPVTQLGAYPVSDPFVVSETRSEAPSTPTITSTDYEDGRIILTVSVSDNGGTDITGYEATCTDGTNSFTGTSTSSPITVFGLTNGVAYSCIVTATNSVGTSSASSETARITPESTDGGLPIWLLYKATH